MAEVRVRYTGKQPIIVNGVTWFQDEIHRVPERTAQALMEMRKAQGDVFVLPLPGMVEPHLGPPYIGQGGTTDDGQSTTGEATTDDGQSTTDDGQSTTDDGQSTTEETAEAWEEAPIVVEEKPKARRRK